MYGVYDLKKTYRTVVKTTAVALWLELRSAIHNIFKQLRVVVTM